MVQEWCAQLGCKVGDRAVDLFLAILSHKAEQATSGKTPPIAAAGVNEVTIAVEQVVVDGLAVAEQTAKIGMTMATGKGPEQSENTSTASDVKTDPTTAPTEKVNTSLDAEKTTEDIKWTNHGFKHFPPKNLAWKDVVSSTKDGGKAKYHPKINVEKIERLAWEQGKMCINGKTWKVMKFDQIIGAKNGIETTCIRVECSVNTIHGHPITLAEYLKLIN